MIKGNFPDLSTLLRKPGIWYLPGMLLLCFVICFFHLWQITDIPKGFYVDELSIGYNASVVARTAHDEHGQFLPIFFESFGEYKNSLYIYVAAIIFKLFGVSDTALRAASFIFYALFLGGIFLLAMRIFRANKMMSLYVLTGAGFLPWFFTLSRIAFEVISQLTVTMWVLLLIHMSYCDSKDKNQWMPAILAGLVLGLSVYTYSTARLLSFLMIGSVAVIYMRTAFKKTVIILAGFVASVIPTSFLLSIILER